MAKKDSGIRSNSLVNISENKIGIIGDNILRNGSILTAYYILPLANYSVTSENGVLNNVEALTGTLTNLANQRPGVSFSLQKISKVIRAQDVYNNLMQTIQMYKPDYDMPEEFTSHISDNRQNYCLLGVDIQQTDMSNVEDYSAADTIKELMNSAIGRLFGSGNYDLDLEKIVAIENNIYNAIRSRCVRATRDLVFYNYVSKLYPSYEISYDKQSYFTDENFSAALGIVNQTVEDNFGYFTLHNEGVDFFDLPSQPTYGCILDVKSFPKMIYSSNFPYNYEGVQIQVNIQTLRKEDAEIQIKRRRSSDKYDLESAITAGAESEDIQQTAESISYATEALADISNGMIFCKFNTSILVYANTLEQLRRNTQTVISISRDRDILVSKSLTQATDFMNSFVKLVPTTYNHMAALQFPLSFQLNSGAIVGGFDSKFFLPSIGEAIE